MIFVKNDYSSEIFTLQKGGEKSKTEVGEIKLKYVEKSQNLIKNKVHNLNRDNSKISQSY